MEKGQDWVPLRETIADELETAFSSEVGNPLPSCTFVGTLRTGPRRKDAVLQAVLRVVGTCGLDLTDVSGVALAGVESSTPPPGGAPPGDGRCPSEHRFVRTAGDLRSRSRSCIDYADN